MRKVFLSIILMFMLGHAFVIAEGGASELQSSTILKVVPPPIDVIAGQNFTVTIHIYDVERLVAFQFKVCWDPVFVDYVSHEIFPPWQPPMIIPDPVLNRTGGWILIGACSMFPEQTFMGSATLVTMTFEAVESGSTCILIREPMIEPTTPCAIEDAHITILPPNTWVTIVGTVDSYGVEAAYGWLNVFAKVEEWAEGWSVFVVPPLGGFRILIYPPPPIEFTIYVVRIINASAVKLDHEGADFWLSGFWEIGNVTNPTSMKDILELTRNMKVATGELNVTDSWSCFSLTIEGLESIRGNITAYCVREFDEPGGQIPHGDINCDYTVDMQDILILILGYGSVLGFNSYDLYGDLNLDLSMDMQDIYITIKNFGEEY